MFYNGYAKGGFLPLAAVSEDGINFRPRNTADKYLSSPTLENQLMEGIGELAFVYEDKFAPESERLKALATYGDLNKERIICNPLYVSKDGCKWERRPVEWHSKGAEPGAMCFYNDFLKRHCIIARPDPGVRRVSLIETEDFKSFTSPSLVMTPDSLDEPLAEHYGMPVFPYADIFVGFLWIYHPENQKKRKYWEGKVDAQLVYSYNGTNFNRTLREPIFKNDDDDCAGMIFPSFLREEENRKRTGL